MRFIDKVSISEYMLEYIEVKVSTYLTLFYTLAGGIRNLNINCLCNCYKLKEIIIT